MKKQGKFAVSKVETNDTLREVSRERNELFVRIAINSSNGIDSLSDAQKAMLDELTEEEREITLKGQLTREISSVFRVSSFVDGLDNLSEDELTDEEQDNYISQLSDMLKAKNKDGKQSKFIFTYFTFTVEELLRGTAYDGTTVLYAENSQGTISTVRQRNNLYFGFFDDDDEALSFVRSRLIADVDNGTLSVDNPNDVSTPTPEAKPKRQLTLK